MCVLSLILVNSVKKKCKKRNNYSKMNSEKGPDEWINKRSTRPSICTGLFTQYCHIYFVASCTKKFVFLQIINFFPQEWDQKLFIKLNPSWFVSSWNSVLHLSRSTCWPIRCYELVNGSNRHRSFYTLLHSWSLKHVRKPKRRSLL